MKVSKKLLLSLAAASLAVIPSLSAEHSDYSENSLSSSNQTRYVYADVVDVQPIKRYVSVSRPERVCEDVEYRPRRRSNRHDSSGGTIAGGLLGGVIGRQFGSGSGRDAATVAGVLIGSAIGHDKEANKDRHRSRNDRYETRTRQECSTRYQRSKEERIDGYNVTYRYQGEIYTTRTRYEPGKQIRLAVDVRPVEEDYQSHNDDYSDKDDNYDRYATNLYDSKNRD